MGNNNAKKSTFGLSPGEKKILRETWKLVKKDLGRNGLVVFVIFFRDYPKNLKYFPFKVGAVEDLEREPLVKLHALRVMRELDFCVLNMDKQETLLYALRQNALSHRRREIHQEAYDELRVSILKGLAHQLGTQKFKPEADAAWDKALRVIFQIINDINDEKKCMCPPQNRNMNLPPDYSGPSTSRQRRR